VGAALSGVAAGAAPMAEPGARTPSCDSGGASSMESFGPWHPAAPTTQASKTG